LQHFTREDLHYIDSYHAAVYADLIRNLPQPRC
jgi:hypothetical protein